MSSVFVDWLVNDIVELELSFLYKYLSLERTKGAKFVFQIYNILRRYQFCIKFDNQRKML